MNSPHMSRRFTAREVVSVLGLSNLGELAKLRSKGSRHYESLFPLPVSGFFIEAEILAWKKSKEDKATQSPSTPERSPK